ncbi:hypothetical protein BB545_12930, partial [Escherichia coli]
VYFIEFAYVMIVLLFILYYNSRNMPFIEGLFLILIICSPYSISIIPFRQDMYEIYGIYSNNGILNIVNFYKIAGLSILDMMALLIIVININTVMKIPSFFIMFYFLVGCFSIIGYSISSYLFWSPELDNIFNILSVFKSIIYIISVYCAIDRICKHIGFDKFIKFLANLILCYCIINALILCFLPDWYTWVKYSFNYLFLDQTDQFLVFLYCLLAVWGPLSGIHRYKIYALILCIMLLLSGGKGGVYSLVILAMAWLYKNSNINSAILSICFFLIMILSWMLSYYIGFNVFDLSIYTRYFQVNQLFLNYMNNILTIFFGIGPSKAYFFYSEPAILDPGAYTSSELNSSFKIGFQMPYLTWIKNFGLSGLILLYLSLNYVVKTARHSKSNEAYFSGIVYALGLYFLLVGFMDFPSFGLKTIIPISLYIYIVKMNATNIHCEGRK